MSDIPLVSIIMPVFNAAPYLTACIDSIRVQSFANWELLIVDDFSTDDSARIIASFLIKDKRIKTFTNIKKGIIPALSSSFAQSKGKYITRMDADDLMPPNKLKSFIAAISDNPKSVITGKVRYFSDAPVSEGYIRYENWLNQLTADKNHWSSIYRECVIASPNWMVSRSCFETVFLFSELVYPEDYDMAFKWYANDFEVLVIPEITHLWREHANRTSRHMEAYQQKAFFKLKTARFLELELENDEPLQLIGAGDKGKLVAKELIEHKQPFLWFDLKVYKNKVLNQEIRGVSQLKGDIKTILTVWPIEKRIQAEIQAFLHDKGLYFGENCWLF